jgi:hypothetical protein
MKNGPKHLLRKGRGGGGEEERKSERGRDGEGSRHPVKAKFHQVLLLIELREQPASCLGRRPGARGPGPGATHPRSAAPAPARGNRESQPSMRSAAANGHGGRRRGSLPRRGGAARVRGLGRASPGTGPGPGAALRVRRRHASSRP